MGVAFENKKKLPAGELNHAESESTEIDRVLGNERVSHADVLTISANLTADEPLARGFQEANASEFFREEADQDRLTPLEASKFCAGWPRRWINSFRILGIEPSAPSSGRGCSRQLSRLFATNERTEVAGKSNGCVGKPARPSAGH